MQTRDGVEKTQPRHDEWFDQFVAEWGEANGVTTQVDHVNTADVPAAIAAEIAAGEGHDIVEHIASLAQYEKSVLDMTDVVEELKWVKPTSPGTPVWSHDGIICTGESYKSVVKLTFAKGASLRDPAGLFNSSLDGNVRRAIDIRESEDVDASAFKALVRDAVTLNTASKLKSAKKTKS